MGTKNFTTFQADLKLELGQRDDLDSYLDNWVNAAYITLATKDRIWTLKRKFYFPQLETSTTASTSDGVAYVSVPSDCLAIRHVWDSTNDLTLVPVTWGAYVQSTGRATSTSEGKPTQWVRRGSYIYLYPTPDATYSLTIYYRKVPAVLSAGGDVTAIGTEWDEPITKLAVIQSLMRLKEYDKAKLEKDEWLEMVSELLSVYGSEELTREEYFHLDPAYRG